MRRLDAAGRLPSSAHQVESEGISIGLLTSINLACTKKQVYALFHRRNLGEDDMGYSAVVFAALAAGLFSMQGADAATTTFSDGASFHAALGTTVVDDYENSNYQNGDILAIGVISIHSDAHMSAVLGETDYQTTGFSDRNIIQDKGPNHDYCAGCNGSFVLRFTSTSVGTSDGVYGVGFNFLNTSDPLYVAFVTFGDGSTLNFQLGQAMSLNGSFFGLTSDLLITSIALGLTDGGTTTSGYFEMDNLTIGSKAVAPVPLPASGLLFLGGLAGLAATRRKSMAPRA